MALRLLPRAECEHPLVPLLAAYREDDRPQKTGYQLFFQTRFGWRWAPRAPGFWIEPAVAFNWWPVEVGRPASFREKDGPRTFSSNPG